MTLINDVRKILDSLAAGGWNEVFEAHGLNIGAGDLKNELLRNISSTVNRQFPGFEDFAFEGQQGITPGVPARSLIYHALAGPNVVWKDFGKTEKLEIFPTLEQIETIENYVYGINPPSLSLLESLNGKENLGVVVFANQYRTAVDTPHQKHADLVYSRTGVSRIGTEKMLYDAETRSFEVLSDDPQKVRVLPAKYNAYLAVKMNGSKELLGRRFNVKDSRFFSIAPPDENLTFWFPVHKLFSGNECLSGQNLKVSLEAKHLNEKIRRIHKFIQGAFDLDPGSNPTEQGDSPFRFSDNIADFSTAQSLVVPQPASALVQEAEINGRKITLNKSFPLPTLEPPTGNSNSLRAYSSSLELRSALVINNESQLKIMPRSQSEYMHIRTKVSGNSEIDLNTRKDVAAFISNEKYQALHYTDSTGDGVVSVKVAPSTLFSYPIVFAYSLVSAPDFFPFCDQTEVFDQSPEVWSTPPLTLADSRILPNIKTHNELIYQGMEIFDTCTALIAGVLDTNIVRTFFEDKVEKRVSYLTDAAAGYFAPGWDTSFDTIEINNSSVPHLAAYGLGSPFPEDAKLCAALSSFWAAVAPDITRSFWWGKRQGRTVLPLTDEEIGGNVDPNSLGWDGEKGPVVFEENGKKLVRFKKFEYVDYTLNALHNKFNFHILAKIDAKEYKERVLACAAAQIKVPQFTPLIGYQQITDGDEKVHEFRFMTLSKDFKETQSEKTIEILQQVVVTVDGNGHVASFTN